ncbi:MAG: DNA-directed RNA polymerase subunit alpha [Patescibacteria group bacterium]
MIHTSIVLPSKPKVISEKGNLGSYEVEGLYPGYGHTLGNSLRRIILSSLTGFAITSVKIAGIPHEFSTIKGISEDVIQIILNLKRIKFSVTGSEEIVLHLKSKGIGEVKAKDIEINGQVEILTPDAHIATVTEKDTVLDMEITLTQGVGYVAKEMLQKDRVAVGTIALDASFSPIVHVSYDVEQMRVGERTDFNKLIISIETDGAISPKEAFEKAVEIMIVQLKAIINFVDAEPEFHATVRETDSKNKQESEVDKDVLDDVLKTRIESLEIGQRTINALIEANIRTIGGLIRKKEQDILDIDGIGSKGLEELKEVLGGFNLSMKE